MNQYRAHVALGVARVAVVIRRGEQLFKIHIAKDPSTLMRENWI